MKQGQFPAVIRLADLNGQNGFKLDGEVNGDQCGSAVSAAGDINGDGNADLLIGAWRHTSDTGRSYVVFGGSSLGKSGILSLSSLNGTTGFKLDGETSGDQSGYSVSSAGDINSDGYTDMVIGARGWMTFTGRTYVVFGGLNIGNGGKIALSSLNGTDGFKLDGESSWINSGRSVHSAGDINADGHTDLVIGALSYPNTIYWGRVYVIFGGLGIGNAGTILLSSLNGTNGFKLDGEAGPDELGISVDAAGDINADGYIDLVIGADRHAGDTGRSYVFFGGANAGIAGTIPISSLNGTNGFKLDGENKNDKSGFYVGGAGDLNGDGYEDILIGAPNYLGSSYQGRSYVVFGGPDVGASGLFNLSGLTGVNGFKLDGENNHDHSGVIHTAGDMNGDGFDDLIIGAYGYPANAAKGRSYVVFGGPKIGSNHRGIFNLSKLDGINGFILEGENNQDQSGYSVSVAGDINGDGIADLIIGSPGYPSSTSAGRGRVYVVFGDAPPVLVNNYLSLSVGAVITLNSTFLAAYDRNHNNNTLVFIPDAIEHGQFEAVSAPGISLTNFTQQQVTDEVIQFIHDGSLVAPSYNITVRSDGIAWTGPVSAKVDFTGTPRSYFPEILPLGSLDGRKGFKLDGENNDDLSGCSVSAAGDVNGDGMTDLVVGASEYPAGNQKGRSYVLFDGAGVGLGNNGVIALSSLNGTNGFKLDGENSGDWSGVSVSAAGDVNGDGVMDLVIGTPNYLAGSLQGRSYVVFGGPGVGLGDNGVIALSSLNGTNGFKLDGENNNDWSGYSVSAAGDVNGDGVTDLVIGAFGYPVNSNKGRSYVVFGGSGVGLGNNGVIALSSLNGSSGFKLDGENNYDRSGYSVSAAGDVNGDGLTDLVIGAYGYPANSNKGRSYVVFGGPGVGLGNNGVITLSSLNGTNGFKLDGENNSDLSGYSVSAAGDVNGDEVADLLIGAHGYPASSYKGRSYVVFGGPGVGLGNNGVIALSSLNGTNGFKLDGENNYDYSGFSVSAVGDVNGDGVADLLIGAYGYPAESQKGRSYVLFGGAEVGLSNNGVIALSSLNGANGFKLDGENNYDASGYPVSAAGDVNGDGVADLVIGARGYSGGSGKGRSYVVFGDTPPVLVQNRLPLSRSQTLLLNSAFLSAYDRNHPNQSIIFFPTNVTHGYFENINQPGIPLTNFTQPQLGNNTIQFVHDDSTFAPSYNITVRSDGIAWTGPHPANVSFSLSTPSPTLVSTPGPTPTPTAMPTFSPTPTVTTTPPSTPTPTATPSLPPIVLLKNQLALSDGQTLILSSNQLQATEPGFNDSQLVFVVSNVQNGYFSSAPVSGSVKKNLTSFTQGQIQSGGVEFIHNGNQQAPGYMVSVTDGVQYTPPSIPTIYFTYAPIITENTLTLQPGEAVTLTPSNLNVTITDGSTAEQVICRVEDIQHATITQLPSGLPISNFTLADIQSGKIQVTQDNSNYAAVSYVISCGGQKGLHSVPSTVDTHFSYNGVLAPQLIDNYLLIQQGGIIPLSVQNIRATQNGSQPLASNALFYVSAVTHGQFSLSSMPGSIITSFSQEQLQEGSVIFTQDNSKAAPGYRLSVRALGLESASLPASVIFRPVNQPPTLTKSLTDQSATVGEPFTYAISADSFVDPEGEALTFTASRYNSSASLPAWLHFDSVSRRFSGAPVSKDFIQVNVTAQDPEGLSTTTDFTMNIASATSDNGFTTWQKTIIGALISGGIGIGFAIAQICLKRLANKKLLQVLGEGDNKYDQDVVRPVMKEIAQRIKITRFMNATTNKELMAFKSAVRSLLSALEQRQVNLNFSEMKESKRDEVINEIGNQTYRWMKANQKGCAARCPGLHSFFKSQLKAEDLQDAAEKIADQVVLALQKPARNQPSLSRNLSVSGSPVFGEEKEKRKSSVDLSLPDAPASPSQHREEVAAQDDLPLSQLSLKSV